uniref:Uncharacterized protein n=1 Tax=Arundo donax TaxID=35708 RepID=A0A0A9EG61_ARUDO
MNSQLKICYLLNLCLVQLLFLETLNCSILILCFCITLSLFDFRRTLSLKETPFLLQHF